MAVSRRTFLGASAVAALTTACGGERAAGRLAQGPALRERTIDDVIARALDHARRGGASYADVRIVRRRTESIAAREDHVVSVGSDETYGVGVRVLVDGAWGFASSSIVDAAASADAADGAVAIAKVARAARKKPVVLARTPVVKGAWRNAVQLDPFEVPLAEKAAYLLELWPLVKDVRLVKYATSRFEALSEWKIFASSEGSVLEQTITRVAPRFEVTAVMEGQFETRAAELPPVQGGWEHITGSSLKAQARAIAEDAVEKLRAPSVKPGRRDLVLAPSNLWLTIHESVGHPTELDRALGFEANFAGTSFATTDKLRSLAYGSELVTLYADKTTPGALATCGWDDEGVATQRWDLVKNGLFVGYQTTREQAAFIGESASRGTSYAEDHKTVTFQRMPNVSLAPDPKGDRTLADLVSATDDGVLVSGDGSWSIDHQRYNFQFSGQTFHEIKKGKIVGPLRDVAYQANSLDFWRSCDLLGGPRSWQMHGTMWDGKGEPQQANAVSHGCPAARFHGVEILNVNQRGAS